MSFSGKREFKREYIPVIITGLILIILVGALIFMISYKGNLKLEEVPNNSGHEVNEFNVDIDKDKCSNDLIKQLTKEAKKIEMEYKDKTIRSEFPIEEAEEANDENLYSFQYVWTVFFKNMTDNFYLKITNDKTDEVKTITKDTLVDGKWQFDTEQTGEVITYTISVISNVDNCNEQVFRKFELKALIYNAWHTFSKCSVFPEFKYCQKWTDENLISLNKFNSELKKYKKQHPEIKDVNSFGVNPPTTTKAEDKSEQANEENKTTSKKEDNSKEKNNKENKEEKNNYLVYGAVAIIVIAVGVVIVILLKKKRSK